MNRPTTAREALVAELIGDVAALLARVDSLTQQTQAMAQAAQTIFEGQVTPVLQRLANNLERIALRVDRPWETWLTHITTAVISAGGSAALVLLYLGKW